MSRRWISWSLATALSAGLIATATAQNTPSAATQPATTRAAVPPPTTQPAAAKTPPATAPLTPPRVVPPPAAATPAPAGPAEAAHRAAEPPALDLMSMVFVFMLATIIGIGVIRRVSRLLHTPLMSLTNAISAIAVVGAIMVAGGLKDYPIWIRTLGAVALFCSMTNIISGFLITDRMLKMFKTRVGAKP